MKPATLLDAMRARLRARLPVWLRVRSRVRAPGAALVSCLALAACGSPAGAPEAVVREPKPVVAVPKPAARTVDLPAGGPAADAGAPGFVVWESSRSGAWRLWRADLDGGRPRQLSPDEPGRPHCCPHVAPDGRRIAYLSLAEGRQRYRDEQATGELRLLAVDGSPAALPAAERSAASSPAARGSAASPRAATGSASRPPAAGDLATRVLARGARTYFEHRAAVWVDEDTLHYIAADGGVRRLDVDTGAETVVLAASGDLSRRWLVDATGRWAASGRALVAPLVGGRPGPETPLPGCQPYFSHDGRHVVWTAGAGGPIDRYDLASGEAETLLRKNDPRLPPGRGYLYFPMLAADQTLLAFAASDGEHDHFGADYDVFVAEVDGGTLEVLGRPWAIAPDPAVDRFPDVWRAPLELGRTVGEAPLDLALAAPGAGDWSWRLDGPGTAAAAGARFAATLTAPGRYAVTASSGGRDARGVAVVLAPAPPVPFEQEWPVRRDGLLWSWSAASGTATTPLLARGRALAAGEPLARPLALAGRSFVAERTAGLLLAGLQGRNQLGLELAFVAPREPPERLAAILAVGRDGARENLLVGQRGDRLVMRMRVGSERDRPYAWTDLGPLAPGRRLHLALAYTPGRLAIFRGGELAQYRRDLLAYFFHWRTYPLTLGDRDRGGAGWPGNLEAVAIYDRPLDAEEVRANAARLSSARPALPPRDPGGSG